MEEKLDTKTQIDALSVVKKMAEESLPPHLFESWEEVEKWLRINRHLMLQRVL